MINMLGQTVRGSSGANGWLASNWLSLINLLLIVVVIWRCFVLHKKSNSGVSPPTDGETRSTIARNVAIFAICGVVGLSALVLIFSTENDRSARFVFGAVLPLLGTWVGTILAYYFARENLAAATQSVSSFADRFIPNDRDDNIPVKDRMRKLADIRRIPVKEGDDGNAKLVDLIKDGVERVVIVNTDAKKDVLRFLIYKSVIDAYRLQPGKFRGKTADTVTLEELLSDGKNRELFTSSWAVIDQNGTVGEARRRMTQKGEKCNDVFVTESGSPDSPIVGWLTDNKLSAA